MFVLALSLYNTWDRGVFLLCKITNLLIYSEEKYYPIKKEMILSKLKMMGYTNISVYCFPSYFKMPEFELVDWYCIMAKKND